MTESEVANLEEGDIVESVADPDTWGVVKAFWSVIYVQPKGQGYSRLACQARDIQLPVKNEHS